MSWIQSCRQRPAEFLFPAETDAWLALFRIGMGLQLIAYGLSLQKDWNYLLGKNAGLINRDLTEAMLSIESPIIPRLGWIVNLAETFGVGEKTALALVWTCLLLAGCLLLWGLFCRTAAVTGWLLHLCAIKSGSFLAYGMDNFTTIGLFYLMLSPLPDHYSLDWRWRARGSKNRDLLGFFRRVLQVHLCCIYFFGGLAKCLGTGWWNGANLWRALIRPPFNLIAPETLVQWKCLYPVAGILIFILEMGYPLFIWPGRTRLVWLAGILVMHIGVGLAMGMYLFSLVMIVLNVAAFGAGVAHRSPKPALTSTRLTRVSRTRL